MRTFYLILFAVAVISFIFINIFLASILYKYIKILPSFSISEAPTYKFPTFDPSKVKVLPGSLIVFISKESPFFSYLPHDTKLYTIVGLYLLTGFLVSSILAIVFILKGKTITSAIIAGILIALSTTLFILSLIFLAPAKQGDLICYSPPSNNSIIICHTLIDVKDDTVTLIRHYDNKTEEIPKEWVVGKVALIIPPPTGALLFITKHTIDFFTTLYYIIAQGNIPVGYSIEYIKIT